MAKNEISSEEFTEVEQDIAEFEKPAQTDKPTPQNYRRLIVQPGECIDSIAERYGFFPKSIWDNPNNKELREKRKEESILLAGDVVFIPNLREKSESAISEKLHRYVRKGVPLHLTMCFLDGAGEPKSNQKYRLLLNNGDLLQGSLDKDGKLDIALPFGADEGELTIGEPPEEVNYSFDLGGLDPIQTVSGIQERLQNLGYDIEEVTGRMNAETRSALHKFQMDQNLEETGQADNETRKKLAEIHEKQS